MDRALEQLRIASLATLRWRARAETLERELNSTKEQLKQIDKLWVEEVSERDRATKSLDVLRREAGGLEERMGRLGNEVSEERARTASLMRQYGER
jgi:predicted  nucleic acid-binding Zn-ribbon protein